MKLTGAEREMQVGGSSGVFIPRSSPIELHGFNTICLRNPKMCGGSFAFGFNLYLPDVSTDGIIFSTTGHDTSIVGTSLLLEGSNVVASVRTVSRIWKVLAPASGLSNVNNDFMYVDLIWNYDYEIKLKIEGTPHTAPYTVVTHIPLAEDDLKNVMRFGGVDLSTNLIQLKIEPYDDWLRKKIHHAGNIFLSSKRFFMVKMNR